MGTSPAFHLEKRKQAAIFHLGMTLFSV